MSVTALEVEPVVETERAATTESARLWWRRPDLEYRDGVLHLGGHDLIAQARASGTPAYFYSGERVRANLKRLHDALATTGVPFRVKYAMKANRFGPLLTWIKISGLAGIDCCSPAEVRHAVRCGFRTSEISYTATSVSETDLDILVRQPDLWINCDSLSSLRRLGRRAPGRTIGLRINPALGVGYGENQLLRYSGDRTSKFGIYREHLDEALAIAAEHRLTIGGIHFHVGCGYLNGQLDAWSQVLETCAGFLDALPDVRIVNLGGGLGVPHVESDRPLDLEAWASIIRRTFVHRNVGVWVEPGDFVVKDAGVLVLQINTVERKRATTFVGVDGGFNLAMEPIFYRLPCEPVPAALLTTPEQSFADENTDTVTLAGNINEALDLWAEGIQLPRMEEGDYLVFLNAGGYAAAMSSDHCMRGGATEHLLLPST